MHVFQSSPLDQDAPATGNGLPGLPHTMCPMPPRSQWVAAALDIVDSFRHQRLVAVLADYVFGFVGAHLMRK